MPDKIILASDNPGKIREIQSMLRCYSIAPQSDFAVPAAEETGSTFVENAIIKARNAAHSGGFPSIADDSGLEVDALHGAPGVFSARYAGDGASDQENLEKVLANLADVPNGQRSARFHCVIVYMRHHEDPCPIISQGTWEGQILWDSEGTNGFGYDPIFYVPEKDCSSAQLSSQEKNRISHRGKALRQLIELM